MAAIEAPEVTTAPAPADSASSAQVEGTGPGHEPSAATVLGVHPEHPFPPAPGAPESLSITSAAGLAVMRQRLCQSADPVEVFTSVADLCAEMGYDCTVILVDGDVTRRIDRPCPGDALATSPVSLLSLLDLTPLLVLSHDCIGISILAAQLRGGMLNRARQGQPSYADALVLRLLVDEAILVITRERLQRELAEERERAANLEQALASNREIAMALGFVMAVEGCDAQAAFDRLRSVSQRTNRKLRDIAGEVVRSAVTPQAAPVGVRGRDGATALTARRGRRAKETAVVPAEQG